MIYRAVADQETLDFLFACTPKDRQTLAQLLRGLASNPFQPGDFEEADSVGRPVQIKLFGVFLVTFWPGHAAKEIRVVRVQKVD